MMPSCKEVSELLSERLDGRLGLTAGLGLRLHLAMCKACARVEKQFQLLRNGMLELPKMQNARPARKE